MKILEYIENHLKKRLDKDKALVVFDPDGLYQDIVIGMADETTTVVDGRNSTIAGREKAMETWCRLGMADDDKLKLIIYLPVRKPLNDRDRQKNPYQIFAIGGGEFPSGDGETYQALCRQAAPDLAPQIDKLFGAEVPDFRTIDNLIAGGANWPKLKTLLNAESAAEIMIAVLSPSKRQKEALSQNSAWLPEFKQFLSRVLDYTLKTKGAKLSTVSSELWRFILFSEFVLDLPGGLPEPLKDVPRAGGQFAGLIFSICDRLRSTEDHQQRYIEMAVQAASELDLEARMAGVTDLGKRDTFEFEEHVYLKLFAEELQTSHYTAAEDILEKRKQSIWVRHMAERQQLWTVADRTYKLLVATDDLQPEVAGIEQKAGVIFDFYCQRFRRIDRLHRDFEQAVTDAFGELETLEKVVTKARKQYFNLIEALQNKFVSTICDEGWPVSGRIRHSEVFNRFVAPWLKERQRIAFFMVDALRYELAVELENELSTNFTTEITAVCAQLPTITSVGMAALMPDADGNFKMVKDSGMLVPYVKGVKVLVPADRLSFMQKIYGDRVHMRDLDEMLTKQRMKIPETTQLLVIKTTDIDQLGEMSPLEARRLIPRMAQKIIAGVNKVNKLGFDRAVITTDHGFILFDNQKAGDEVPKPEGQWDMVKPRCLLGKAAIAENVQVFGKNDVGIDGEFDDYVVPRSFGTFIKGSSYAHQGLSLQECVLPVISIVLGGPFSERKRDEIDIRIAYKGGLTDKITTRRPMIEISMFKTLFDESVELRLEACVGKKIIGEAAASPYVNATSNLVTIKPGQAIKVPLKMDDDFSGSFEVRATDPLTQVNYHTLKLKTDYVD
jgi:hypothetical protein